MVFCLIEQCLHCTFFSWTTKKTWADNGRRVTLDVTEKESARVD